jgi:hypothetical protein
MFFFLILFFNLVFLFFFQKISEYINIFEENIILFALLMAEQGVHNVAYAFPKVKIVTTAVDPELNEMCYILPGIGKYILSIFRFKFDLIYSNLQLVQLKQNELILNSIEKSLRLLNLNGFLLHFLSYSNCNVKNAIYIIRCKLCKDTFYIGETTNVRIRIQRHLNDIINFVPFYIYTCVSNHFNLAIHNNYQLHEILNFLYLKQKI